MVRNGRRVSRRVLLIRSLIQCFDDRIKALTRFLIVFQNVLEYYTVTQSSVLGLMHFLKICSYICSETSGGGGGGGSPLHGPYRYVRPQKPFWS